MTKDPCVKKPNETESVSSPFWFSAHQEALRQGKDFYIDPETGYHVFTELALLKRPCCGNGCRHCPYKKGE